MCAAWIVIALALAKGVAAEGVAKEPALLQELIARTKKDQDARSALMRFDQQTQWSFDAARRKDPKLAGQHRQLVEKAAALDKENTAWLKRVVAKHGWPGRSLVGRQGAHLAWLLVQHADEDRPFQKECLERMRKMPKGEVDPKDLAYLTDRVAVGEGRKQLYGTQLIFKDGRLVPQTPIEDEANVDKRRAEWGLPSMKEYLEFIEKSFYGKPPAKADKPSSKGTGGAA
jgi:hypothetical protein